VNHIGQPHPGPIQKLVINVFLGVMVEPNQVLSRLEAIGKSIHTASSIFFCPFYPPNLAIRTICLPATQNNSETIYYFFLELTKFN